MRLVPRTGRPGIAVLLLSLTFASALQAQDHEIPRVAILSALSLELAPVKAELTDRASTKSLGIELLAGTLSGRPVVLGSTGVGKVNAAMSTALLLERFRPRAVIFTGIAGALDPQLQPGDVVIGDQLVRHDLVDHTSEGPVPRSVRNPLDDTRNPIFFRSSPWLVALAERARALAELETVELAGTSRPPRVLIGTIATGDNFVGSQAKKTELREQLGAHAVEMEGAAVAQVCHEHGVPVLVVRGVSDRAGAGAGSEARRYFGVAARNAARIAMTVVDLLGKEDASP